MDKTLKKTIRRVIAWVSLAALVAVLTAMPLLARQNAEADGPVATVKSGTLQSRTISRTLSGGGVLSEEDAEEITIPAGVKLKSFLVGNGDAVSEGDALAQVDKLSVMEAITQVQETLDYLAKQIKAADDDEGASKIKSQTSGKVKVLYAQAGDNVQDVILQHGALAVLSLDGRMAVSLETTVKLAAGDTVTVTFADGKEVSGRVESCLVGKLTVSIPDDNYALGEEVTLTAEDGEALGSGKLEISNPWNAAAYFGTVSNVHVKENQTVSAGTVLFTLKDVDHATTRALLVSQRQEYEDLMAKLFTMYETGVLSAPCDGIVSGVDEESPHLLRAAEDGWFFEPLAAAEDGWTIQLLSGSVEEPPSETTEPTEPSDPTEPSEPEVITYTVRVGMVKAADKGLLSMLMANGTQTVTSLKDVMISVSQMTTPAAEDISAASVYELSGEALKPLDYTSVKAGDILLFATDSLGGYAVVRTTVSGGTQKPGGMGSIPNFGGFSGGMGSGGAQTQPAFQLFDLTETTVLAVTPNETMTLDITVDELDIGLVQPGMAAKITVTALGAEQFPGTVTEIGTAVNSGGHSKFTVTITLARSEKMLGSMSATAVMELDTLENVLCIPTAALQEDGSRLFVYTGYDAKKETFLEPVDVTIGASDGEYTQILTGLTEGDTFYYAYYDAPATE